MSRPLLPALLLLAVACLAGCRTPPASPDAPLPVFEVLDTRPASGEVHAEDLYPLRHARFRYTVVEGDGVGSAFAHVRTPAERFNADWSDAEGDERTQFWTSDPDGNLVMTAVIEHDDKAISLFRPPLIIAYRTLPAGERRHTESDMLVVSESNPRQRRESGTGTRTIEYVDDQLLRTPLGEHWAKRIEVEFTADLSLAEAQKSGTFWIVPDLGILVQRHDERIRVLAVAGDRERRTSVLTAIDDLAGSPPTDVNAASR